MQAWIVIVLSTAGSALEGAGIVIVADRVSDLSTFLTKSRRTFRARVVDGQRRLSAFFPAHQMRVPGLGRTIRVGAADGVAVAEGAATLEARRILGGPLPDRIQRVADEHAGLAGRVDRLDADLDLRIKEGAQDRVAGLILLFAGLVCLLAANIVSVI